MRLTDKSIRDLITCPTGMTERTYWDSELPGFGLRVRPSGARSWLVQYAIHGRTRKVTLGAPPVVTVGTARAAARQIMAAKAVGRDPAKERAERREQAANTIGTLIPSFIERQRKRLKPRSMIEVERHLVKHAKPLHGQGVKSIDRRAIAKLLEAIERDHGAGAANCVRASLSAFMTWAARAGHIDSNPVAFTNRAIQNGARERVLADDEIAMIWNALDDGGNYAALVRLLLLTGARREEIARLRWSEIDLEAALIRLPSARTKNGRPHDIPLSAKALAILKSRPRQDGRDFVLGSNGHGYTMFSQSKRQLDAKLGDRVAPWVLHDLRRTLSTRLHGAPFSIPPHICETLLGHVGGHRSGVAGTYNRADYLVERRAALARWAAHLDDLLEGRATNVVALHSA
jgi:integrase